MPVRPDFVVLGNFTGQGNKDLAVATQGGNALLIFANDGKGNFSAPQTVNVAGGVTALASGELGHTPVLIVGSARSLTVYVSLPQGLTALASNASVEAMTGFRTSESFIGNVIAEALGRPQGAFYSN